MDKMATLRRTFAKMGMLAGTTSSYMAQMKAKDNESRPDEAELHDEENEDDDGGPASGNSSGAMSDVKLASKCGMYNEFSSGCFPPTDLYRISLPPQSLSTC